MKSIWSDVAMPIFPALTKDISTEVLIIGGGMAGVLCAYFLEQMGVPYVLAEAKTIGSGVTKNTTAVITAQHDALYSDLIQTFGQDKARLYLKANLDAVRSFRELSKTVPCDFEEKPSFIYSQNDRMKMVNEADAVKQLGFGLDVQFVPKVPLPVTCSGAVKFMGMAQFHPMMFLSEISRGLNIYENTYIDQVKDNVAYTVEGKIEFKKVIIATHFPFINESGWYPLKLYQKRSYVIAIEANIDIGGTYVDDIENGMYFRNYKNLLLIGGGEHRTGQKGGNYNELRDFIRQNYPNAVERYSWATQDCISLDGMPYIGRYSDSLPNVYVATGFNEWGMTSSMISAYLLCDMVIGKKNEYEEVFSPQRSSFHGQLFKNMGVNFVNYVMPTGKRCPHLGCSLKWNEGEHSWDCPCHGSRFNQEGVLMNNPAMRNIDV